MKNDGILTQVAGKNDPGKSFAILHSTSSILFMVILHLIALLAHLPFGMLDGSVDGIEQVF
ncbi:MAG: hypothetical protein U9P12_02365 [Verrucomicrobiota bacterium]|nr:hypothetical protein [Verrucomicrobiota bacterium]